MKISQALVYFSLLMGPAAGMGQAALSPGVPKTLAEYRASAIAHINYHLHFTLPAVAAQPVEAAETIGFDWNPNNRRTTKDASASRSSSYNWLPLDFRDSASSIYKLDVNGRPAAIVLRKEHLLIDPVLLQPGLNTIDIVFRAGWLSLNRNPDYLYTLLVPDRARTLFPCFDQPDLKAIFTLTLTLPAGWKAVANAPLADSTTSQPISSGSLPNDSAASGVLKTLRFQPSDLIPTYLFAFAAGRFDEIRRDSSRFYYRETDSVKLRLSIDPVFNIQAEALRFMEDYTGIPFPFRKFDFIAIPDFQFGGMEHPGAIQYRASSLFLPAGATRDQLINRSNLLSHETAHIWFGDLVTMRWFNDVWMKEVFANFFADKIGGKTLPETNFALKFLTDHLPAAYSVDRTAGTNPIRQPLENLQDAGSLYGNIIYNKAPVMMRQLETLMGEGPFRDGLREYLHKYAYGNASWPELIRILGAHTRHDLAKWSQAWIETAGRPWFSYSVTASKGRISAFTLFQKTETGQPLSWPQSFRLTLVYKDHTEQVPVFTNGSSVRIRSLEGRPAPRFFLFNTGGEGYALFPVDTGSGDSLLTLADPLVRASAYINLYENMLAGRAIGPRDLFELAKKGMEKEKEELNLGLLLDYLQSVYWRFLSPEERKSGAADLEKKCWRAMQGSQTANIKKLVFKTFSSIAQTPEAMDSLYAIWKNQAPPAGVTLSEEDYTGLATGLALRVYPGWRAILQQQLARIRNIDNRLRLEYLLPSLSDDQAERDRFFASLADVHNRQKESWVLSALTNLHHPLRAGASLKYVRKSLDLLEAVHAGGGVFFPQGWLQATLGYYNSPAAAAIVRQFLKDHPRYDPALKRKILQTADNLFRAEKLVIPPSHHIR